MSKEKTNDHTGAEAHLVNIATYDEYQSLVDRQWGGPKWIGLHDRETEGLYIYNI